MQFTPQQLSGGAKFSPVTRIGNWQEELALEEAKINNFQKRSANGNLSLRRLEAKIRICNTIVPVSSSEDGILRFGDTVILQHASSESALSYDPFEIVEPGQNKYLVTTVAGEVVPKARNVFVVTRPPLKLCDLSDNPEDPIVHIGQPFMLASHGTFIEGSAISSPIYLSSTKKNERTATKRTNRQMVYMSSEPDAEAIWLAILPSRGRANASERFLAMGNPINVHDGFLLTHRQTNMYLTCDEATNFATEFGTEYEAYANRSAAFGKLGLMVSEFTGLSTSQTLSKPDAASFNWHFVTK